MSDIFNPPRTPNPIEVTCPDCGKSPGTTCSDPNTWNCGARIWVAQQLMILESLKQPEPASSSTAPKDSYAEGWNDAIDAIYARFKH